MPFANVSAEIISQLAIGVAALQPPTLIIFF